jgi:uncharacterized protein (TIGR02145 family)
VNVTGTGVGTVEGTKSLHTPACSEDDIAVWGTTGNPHVWAACNAGATTAYSNQSVTLVNPNAAGGPTAAQKAYMGAYYQWGRNIDVTTGATVAGPLAPVTAANAFNGTLFITNGTPPYDWVTPKNDNLWGGVGSTTSTGTHSSLGSPVAMRGPCAAGYHVPTAKEWCDAIFAVSPTRSGGAAMTCSSTSYQVEAAPNKFMTTLKLPLAGLRNHSPAEFGNQGLSGHYWASSTVTVSDSGYTVSFSSTHGVRSHGSFPRAGGFTVRCLKD